MRAAVILILAIAACFGQADTRARFEVAPEKVSDAGSRTRWNITPGQAVPTHSRLKDLVPLAYGLQPFLVSGTRAWFETEFYDIAAKTADARERAQVPAALQVDGDELPEGTPGGFEGRSASRLVRKKTPISSLVSALSAYLGAPVVDETALTGSYSFVLEWGLVLETSKGPVDNLVIDSAERPSMN